MTTEQPQLTDLVIVYGGELAKDVAEQIVAKKPAACLLNVSLRRADERPKALVDLSDKTIVCFVMQTIENGAPTEDVRNAMQREKAWSWSRIQILKHSPASLLFFDYIWQGGACLRFFKRKTHPENLLQGKFHFTVFGLGDSNLLLDRQSTGAKDCNQTAQELDIRLEAVGGDRHYELGVSDERTGLTEVEPWIDGFWLSLAA
jgi:sulfite reductase alpha subunit-like flavoprotein